MALVDVDPVGKTFLELTGSEAFQVASVRSGLLRSNCGGETVGGESYAVAELAPGYCMSRIPILGAVLLLTEMGYFDVHDRLRDYVDISFVSSECSIGDIVNHRAGLATPDLVSWRMSGGNLPLFSGRKPIRPARGYSDLMPGVVLSALIEAVASCTALEFIEHELLRPARVLGLLQYSPEISAVNPAVAGMPCRYAPLLSECLADQVEIISPATGIFGCAEGFARLLSWLFVDGPDAQARMTRVVNSAGDAHWDPILGRSAKYAFGFMSDMSLMGLADAAPTAFGHTAAMSGWVAVVDPTEGAVSVGYSNGAVRSKEDGMRTRNLLLSLCDGELESSACIEGATTMHSRSELNALQFEVAPKQTRSSAFAAMAEQAGRKLLPSKCRFAVELDLEEAGSATMLFDRGCLIGFGESLDAKMADVKIITTSSAMCRWLENPEMRFGRMIVDEDLAVQGNPWFLSALEYWGSQVHLT
jgi:hypothetical protein